MRLMLKETLDPNRPPVIQLNGVHKQFLTANISGLAKFKKKEHNLSIEMINRSTLTKNEHSYLEWVNNGVYYLDNCIYVGEFGFDIRREFDHSAVQNQIPKLLPYALFLMQYHLTIPSFCLDAIV